MHMFRICLLLFISMLCMRLVAAAPCIGEQSARSSYSVYLIPRLPSTTLYQDWAPFIERLGKVSGLCFSLHIPSDFTEFEQAIRAGKPDFVLLNPVRHENRFFVVLVGILR